MNTTMPRYVVALILSSSLGCAPDSYIRYEVHTQTQARFHAFRVDSVGEGDLWVQLERGGGARYPLDQIVELRRRSLIMSEVIGGAGTLLGGTAGVGIALSGPGYGDIGSAIVSVIGGMVLGAVLGGVVGSGIGLAATRDDICDVRSLEAEARREALQRFIFPNKDP